jgi:hypothetical protein
MPIDGDAARFTQKVVNPKAFAPIASQQFDETKPIRARALQPVDGELVDARARLEDPRSVDGKHAVEMAIQAGLPHQRLEHRQRPFDRIQRGRGARAARVAATSANGASVR